MSKIEAKIIADTINPSYNKARITTFEVSVPRFLLAEINTHRLISKSAASNRAIPVKKRIEMVEKDAFIPSSFGQNKPGMQSDTPLDEHLEQDAKLVWKWARDQAVMAAKSMAELNVHKQHANRLLEPFCFVSVLLTATEWDWFFKLRNHPDAQPEFQELANLMQKLYEESKGVEAEHHLPYITEKEKEIESINSLQLISAARCARVSYKTHDGKVSTLEEDLRLYGSLLKNGHLSPFDHVAAFDLLNATGWWLNPEDHRQYYGWIPYRVQMENIMGFNPARKSYERVID